MYTFHYIIDIQNIKTSGICKQMLVKLFLELTSHFSEPFLKAAGVSVIFSGYVKSVLLKFTQVSYRVTTGAVHQITYGHVPLTFDN